jgi:prenyltransferase beta subunit
MVYQEGQNEYWIREYDDQESEHGSNPEAPEPPSLAVLMAENLQYVGFNGRHNKLADTCYSFWVGASLDVSFPLLDSDVSTGNQAITDSRQIAFNRVSRQPALSC